MKTKPHITPSFIQATYPQGCGIMHLLYGRHGDKATIPVKQVNYFDFNANKNTLTIHYANGKHLEFEKSTYGFDDCHEVIMDMFARAQWGEFASHKDYNSNGTRLNGAPLVKDMATTPYKKPEKPLISL